MSGDYSVLALRIRQELADLDRVVARASSSSASAKLVPEHRDAFLDSAALNLHDFYSGLERMFQQIATKVDESVPAGPDWHRELLRQMSLDIPGRRPAVLSPENLEGLRSLLGFRHVVRNVYAFQFKPGRVVELVEEAQETLAGVRADLSVFAEFLSTVSD